MLAFCGGGKDSLVTMKLLERAGKAMAMYKRAFPTLDIEPIMAKYLRIHYQQARILAALMAYILPQMQAAASEARAYIQALVSAQPH